MAYFDSPKNRAIWSKELETLREEREARAQGKEAIRRPDPSKTSEQDTAMREPITFEQLVREEREASGKPERTPKMTEPTIERTVEKDMAMSR